MEEYIVEFTVTMVDPEYSKLLSDPDGPQYDGIKQDLTAKVNFDLRGREDFLFLVKLPLLYLALIQDNLGKLSHLQQAQNGKLSKDSASPRLKDISI